MVSSHFCAVALLGIGPEGQARVLVQEYLYQGQKQLKLPGGMNEPGESPLETARREFGHETELTLKGELTEVWRIDLDGHSKYFYVAVSVEGELRTEAIYDSGGELLEPPVWRDVDYSLSQEIFPSHKDGLINAIGWAAGKHRAFAEAILLLLPDVF